MHCQSSPPGGDHHKKPSWPFIYPGCCKCQTFLIDNIWLVFTPRQISPLRKEQVVALFVTVEFTFRKYSFWKCKIMWKINIIIKWWWLWWWWWWWWWWRWRWRRWGWGWWWWWWWWSHNHKTSYGLMKCFVAWVPLLTTYWLASFISLSFPAGNNSCQRTKITSNSKSNIFPRHFMIY